MTAEQLEHQAAELEAAMLDGAAEPDLAKLDSLRNQSRLAKFRATATARKAERERQAQRMADLAVLHADVLAAAAAVDHEPLHEALTAVRAAAERFGALVEQHNATVAGLTGRAKALGVSAPAPAGPRGDCGFVAVAGAGIQASDMVLSQYPDLRGLPVAAASGQPAVLPPVAQTSRPVQRPAYLVRLPNGTVMAFDDITRYHDQVVKGQMIVLGDEAVDAWMRGEGG